jgi:hypothetical protein
MTTACSRTPSSCTECLESDRDAAVVVTNGFGIMTASTPSTTDFAAIR